MTEQTNNKQNHPITPDPDTQYTADSRAANPFTSPITALDAARAYAALGWPVCPIEPGTRKPVYIKDLLAHGFNDAAITAATFEQWWAIRPDAGVGIQTGRGSNLVVVDCDRKHGIDGEVVLGELAAAHGGLPPTPTARSGGGGVHRYFRLDQKNIGSSTNEVADHVDIRAIGGGIVAPPTVHPSGGVYTWVEGLNPWDVPLAPLPDWLAALCPPPGGGTGAWAGRSRAGGATSGLSQALQWRLAGGVYRYLAQGGTIAAGHRNQVLYRFGCALRSGYQGESSWGEGMDEDALMAHLTDVNDTRCEEPLAEGELRTIVASVMKRPRGDGTALVGASSGTEDPNEVVYRQLAALSRGEFDQIRKDKAKELGITVSTLKTEVEQRRSRRGGGAGLPGHEVTYPQPQPCPHPVDGAALLDLIYTTITSFVVMGEPQAVAAALWTVHTHVFEVAIVTPYLAIGGPTMRVGKTLLIGVLRPMVRRAEYIVHITAPALFRLIDEHCPTLLIDEVDTFLSEDLALRGILNGGFTKNARVIRTEGEKRQLRTFAIFCPKAFAGIGRLHHTLADRSIVITMQRKLDEQHVEEWFEEKAAGLEDIRHQCERWSMDHLEAIREARPALPDALDNREKDYWRILLAIADQAGGVWPVRARAAAVALARRGATDKQTLKIRLLDDIQTILYFLGWRPGAPEVWVTATWLRDALLTMEGSTWKVLKLSGAQTEVDRAAEGETYLTAPQMGRWLADLNIHTYHGRVNLMENETPVQLYIDNPLGVGEFQPGVVDCDALGMRLYVSPTPPPAWKSGRRGYRLSSFVQAFRRYLPPWEWPDEITPVHHLLTQNGQ